MQGWYFPSAHKHYRVIKKFIDTVSVKLTDTFKFKHNAIKNPTVTPEEIILKATQEPELNLQARNDAP